MKSLLVASLSSLALAFNNPTGVDIWCGKAYRSTNASFNPGGQLEAPAYSQAPLLDLRIRPGLSYYTPEDDQGTLIIDAAVSHLNGQAYVTPFWNASHGWVASHPSADELSFDIHVDGYTRPLIQYGHVKLNSTGNAFKFSLNGLHAQLTPYSVTINAYSSQHAKVYTAKTDVRILSKLSSGSMVRVDNLHGGLLVPNGTTTSYSPLFPYSYYTSWQDYLVNSPANVSSFKEQGYNIVHVIPDSSKEYGFDFTEFEAFMNQCDEIGLWVMYDMRYTWKNDTAVSYQVEKVKNHPSLLLYYTGDEPDGAGDPLNATKHAYDLIQSLDPYHPVSMCLNCENFYYKEYSSGADIIMEDVYPVAINATYSIVYHTTCNETYGCCGCDNCEGNFDDIANRLDTLKDYQSWIGEAPKPLWGVPQAFGDSEYWMRNPTPAEINVMSLISINHGAKGLVAWTYPTVRTIEDQTSILAKILTASDVTKFTMGSDPVPINVSGGKGVDAAIWNTGDKSVLISVLNSGYDSIGSRLIMDLQSHVTDVDLVLLGSGWSIESGQLVKSGMSALETDLFVVKVK